MIPDQPAPPDLRPLGVGETLDAAFRLLRQNLGSYLKLTVGFVLLPLVILSAYELSEIIAISGNFVLVNNPDGYTQTVLVIGFLGRLLQLVCFGLLVHLSTRLYMNHTETAGSIVRMSGRRLFPFLGMVLLLGLYAFAVAIVGALASVIFGPLSPLMIVAVLVAWFTYYSLSVPAFWYEGISATAAIGRSSSLVRNRLWKVLGSLSIGLVIVGVFSVGLVALFVSTFLKVQDPLTYVLLTNGLELIGTVISFIVLGPIVAVVYFDCRVRNEGFDLQLKLEPADELNPGDEELPPPQVPW
jgi:hypothetical protein